MNQFCPHCGHRLQGSAPAAQVPEQARVVRSALKDAGVDPTALERLRPKVVDLRERIDAMSEDEFGDWVDALPQDEFITWIALGEEGLRELACGEAVDVNASTEVGEASRG